MKTNVAFFKKPSRWVALFCLSLLLFSLFLSLPIQVSADAKSTVKNKCDDNSPTNAGCLIAYVTGDTSGTISVTAKRQNTTDSTTYTLNKVNNDPGVYLVTNVPPNGPTPNASNTQDKNYLFTVKVSHNGKDVGTDQSETLMGEGDYPILIGRVPTFNIPKPGQPPPPGSGAAYVTGGVYARIGPGQPWQPAGPPNQINNTIQPISFKNTATHQIFTSQLCDGSFPQLSMPEGTYTIQVNFTINKGASPVTFISTPYHLQAGDQKVYLAYTIGDRNSNKPSPNPPDGGHTASVYTGSCSTGDATSGGHDDSGQCETDGGVLSFFVCPVINGLASLADNIYSTFIQPFLQTSTIDISNTGSPIVAAWSSLRNMANLLLLLAILFVPIGRLTGGRAEAYAIKRMIPRILLAVILVNLSLYIVAGLCDIFNILGHSLGDLMLQPFKDAHATDVNLNFGTGAIGIAALVALAFAAKISGGALFLMMVFMFVLLPAIIAFLGVFVTLIVRQGIILFLIIVSPIAFVLYALPNTEHYFKKWWELLTRTLLVYPIIAILFALAQILAGMISQANQTSGIRATMAQVAALIAMLAPLFMIPFAFRLAGGAIHTLSNTMSGVAGRAKQSGFMATSRERAKTEFGERMVVSRAQAVRRLNNKASTATGVRKRALRFTANRVGGHNIFAREAARQAEVNKAMEAQSNGDDTEQRALTVNRQWADAQGGWHTDSQGRRTNGEVRIDQDGNREYRTLGGAWVDDASVENAHRRWGGSQAAKQWALSYEMYKASTQEDQDHLRTRFAAVAQGPGGWNFSDEQSAVVWKGAAFSNQNENRQWKHYGWSGGDLKMDSLALMQEIDERQGNYQMLQQNADTWTTMSQEVVRARQVLNATDGGLTITDAERQDPGKFTLRVNQARERAREVLERASRIAYATESAAMFDSGMRPGDDDNPVQALASGTHGRAPGAGAPGRVQEEVQAFVETVRNNGLGYAPPDKQVMGPHPADTSDPLEGLNTRRGSTPRNPTERNS